MDELFYRVDDQGRVLETLVHQGDAKDAPEPVVTVLKGEDAAFVREILEAMEADQRSVRGPFGFLKRTVLFHVLRRYADRQPEDATGRAWFWAHGDAAEDTARAGVPRRGWGALPPNVFVPYGISERWLEEVVENAILPLEQVLRHGIPRAAYREGFQKDIFDRAVGALAVLRSTRGDELDDLPSTVDIDDPSLFDPAFGVGMAPQARLQRWLPHRILNGMAPALVVKTDRDDEFEARYSFAGLPLHAETPYVTPDVAVRLKVDDPQTVRIRRISIAYRAADGGFEEPVVVDFEDAATPMWMKLRAGRTAACALFLRGQLDQHVGRGHMISEFLAVAVQRTLSTDHPLFCLLASRLEGVAAVNRAADCAIWGPNGLFTLGSQITHLGYAQALRERLAGLDWRRYRPLSKSIASGFHYAPSMLEGSWNTVETYVRKALQVGGSPSPKDWTSAEDWRPTDDMARWSEWEDEAIGGDVAKRYHREVRALFAEIEAHALPFQAWTQGFAGDTAGELFDRSELPRTAAVNGKAMSPLNEATLFDDLVQFCTFAIFMATEAHSWANARQKTDAGDPGWGAVGLRARVDDAAPAANDPADTAWHARARPHPRDEIYQRGIGVILTDTRVDDIGMERDGLSQVWDPLGGDGLGKELVAYWSSRNSHLPAGLVDPEFGQPESHLSRCDR